MIFVMPNIVQYAEGSAASQAICTDELGPRKLIEGIALQQTCVYVHFGTVLASSSRKGTTAWHCVYAEGASNRSRDRLCFRLAQRVRKITACHLVLQDLNNICLYGQISILRPQFIKSRYTLDMP